MAMAPTGPTSEAIYMCFGSVPGEAQSTLHISTSPASGGWIRLTSCSFGGRVSHAQHTSRPTDFEGEARPVRVTKMTDASTVGLLRDALTGRFDQPVVIIFVRTGAAETTEYIRLEMRNCGITEFDMAGGEDRQAESYQIRCETMSVTTWRFDGTTRGAQSVVTLSNEAGRR